MTISSLDNHALEQAAEIGAIGADEAFAFEIALVQNGKQEINLGRKMVQQAGQRQADVAGDIADGGILVAVFGKASHRSRQDLRAARFALAGSAPSLFVLSGLRFGNLCHRLFRLPLFPALHPYITARQLTS